MLGIGDMSNGEIAAEQCGVLTASSFVLTRTYCSCISGCPYLHQERMPVFTLIPPKQNNYCQMYTNNMRD